MTNARFPNATAEAVDERRLLTPPWRNWAASVNGALTAGSLSSGATATALATLTTQFNALYNSTEVVYGLAPIFVTGSFAEGGFQVRLGDDAFDGGVLINQVFGG